MSETNQKKYYYKSNNVDEMSKEDLIKALKEMIGDMNYQNEYMNCQQKTISHLQKRLSDYR